MAALAAALAASPGASGQDTAARSSASDGPVRATVREIQASTQQIVLPVGKSALIDLSQPIKRASIASTDIAEVSVLSPHQVMVTGKTLGVTQLIVWADSEQQFFDVLVEMDVRRLEELLREAVPRAQVRVQALQSEVLLMGTVPDPACAARVAELAAAYAGGGGENKSGSKIINHIRVAGESPHERFLLASS